MSSGTIFVNDFNYVTKPFESGVDLDNYKNFGVYYLSTNLTHSPLTWAVLVVFGRYDTVQQVEFASGEIFYREFRNNSWTDWKNIVTRPSLVVEDYAVTASSTGTGAYKWEAEATKTGYRPLMHTIINGYSAVTTVNAEGSTYSNGLFTAYGYSSRASLNLTIRVLWIREP